MDCKFCKKEVIQPPGKRKKEFCNDTCRSNFWYAKNKKGKPKTGFKFGDTKIVGIAAFSPDGAKDVIKIDPPITLIKAPKNLIELKAMCPFPEKTDERSDWIRYERQKYGI